MIKSNYLELDELTSKIDFDVHIFICSSSFESRCLTIPEEFRNAKYREAIICHFDDNYQIANENLSRLSKILHDHFIVLFYKDDPLSNLDGVVSKIAEFKDQVLKGATCNILLDITTFTHEMILILIYLFKSYLISPAYVVKIVYTPASAYSTDEEIEGKKWLSKGVGEVRTVLGYPGEILPSKKNLLIILVGYEEERVKSIVELFEPSKVLLGHASKEGAISNTLLNKNVSTFEALKSMLKVSLVMEIESFEFTCKEPFEVEELLTSVIEKHKLHYNIIVSCLNNKISTIGCALVGLKHPEIQICYATANQYNFMNYSSPSKRVFIIDL